jgi:hypothetical protein
VTLQSQGKQQIRILEKIEVRPMRSGLRLFQGVEFAGKLAGCVSVLELNPHARGAYCVGPNAIGPYHPSFNFVCLAALENLEAKFEHSSFAAGRIRLDEEAAGTKGGGRFAAGT